MRSTSSEMPGLTMGIGSIEPSSVGARVVASFERVYDEHFDFVWRSARRLGVREEALDDVAQEIFMIVLRRLHEFEARSSVRTWLFGIALGVVRNHRRTLRRKSPQVVDTGPDADPDALCDAEEKGPHALAANAEAVRVLYALLDALEDEKREVFVLIELEQLTVPEAAEVLGVNTNTVGSRLRAARTEFNAATARHRARDGWQKAGGNNV